MQFNNERFYDAINRRRVNENLSWRQLAGNLTISPSTFSRLSQGKKPDVDTFIKVLAWLKLPAEDFVRDMERESRETVATPQDTVRDIALSLRSDPTLSIESADALEDIVRVAYLRFRK